MGIKLKGIDLSYANGTLDLSKWNKIKADGIQFAILRAGYGGETNQKDAQFENNYKIAKSIKMPVGAYHFSYAKTVERAKREAEICLQFIKGKTFEYPVYFDVEDANSQGNLSVKLLTDMVVAFCEKIKAAGYKPGVYASKSWFLNKLDYSRIAKYSIWCAQYYDKCTLGKTHDMWQHTEDGKVYGLSGVFDLNWCYKDFAVSSKPEEEEEEQVKKLEKKKNGVITVSYKQHGNCEVTKNFKLSELRCNDKSDTIKFSWRTINWLQDLRDFFGHSVKITSAYRTSSWNIAQGGASRSKHTEGKAIDHYILKDPYPVTLIAKFYEVKGAKCVICYTGQGFVHVDSRGFDGDTSGKYYSYNDKTSVSTFLKTVKRGIDSQDVKDLQLMLKKHGYSLSADGIFGKDTEKFVRDYQKKTKLSVDGIVGAATWRKLLSTTTLEGKTPIVSEDKPAVSVDVSGYPTISQKANGNKKNDYVRDAQKKLIAKGYSCGSAGADGYFGTGTTTAVKKFQKAKGLTSDGIIGKNTWKKLMN